MSNFSVPQLNLQARSSSRSMGLKLIVVSGLALAMTIPALFVSGLAATVILLSANAGWIFESRAQGLRAFASSSLLYALIYMLLRLEDNALLVGAIASFLAVAAVMYFTRKIDWYSSIPIAGSSAQTPSSALSKDSH